MTNRIAAIAVIAAACTAGDKGVDSGVTTDSGTNACPQGTFTDPVSVQNATVECLDTSTVRFYVRTAGWTDDGYVFAQNTADESTGQSQYSDNHDMISYEYDPCGFDDELQQELNTGVLPAQAARNQSTVFSCVPGYHYDDGGGPATMTYGFAVNDVGGNVADCLAFGDDVNGMKNETYNRLVEPDFDLNICSAGVTSR
jgi:hypothetical protein